MPGSNMGYLHPKSEVMRVRTAGAVAVMAAMVDLASSDFRETLSRIFPRRYFTRRTLPRTPSEYDYSRVSTRSSYPNNECV